MNASNKFKLNGGDGAFADRQKKLFDQLSIAEKEYNRHKNSDTYLAPEEVEYSDPIEECHSQRSGRKRKSETRQFRGKESIFKRPEGPAPRNNCQSIPDHHKNPNKWMKYSLDDVSNDDMTDCSNARTAFAFLKELKARKAKEEEENKKDSDVLMDTNDSEIISFKKPVSTSIQFKKPERVECSGSDGSSIIVTREEKPIFLSSKIVMPEYVVGQKQKKKKDKEKKARVKVDRTKELKLNHLEELDEEDDQI